MTRVLIVEDNSSIAQGVRTALLSEGFDVRIAGDGVDVDAPDACVTVVEKVCTTVPAHVLCNRLTAV